MVFTFKTRNWYWHYVKLLVEKDKWDLKYSNVSWILNTRYCTSNAIQGKLDLCWLVLCLSDLCVLDLFYLTFVCLTFVHRLTPVGRWPNTEKSLPPSATSSCLRYSSCPVNYCRPLPGTSKAWTSLMIHRYVDYVCIWTCKSDLKWDIIVTFLCTCKCII